MAGIVVEYARFVDVQQRRARILAHRMRWPREMSQETNRSAAADDQPSDTGESQRHVVSMQGEAAQHRGGTARGSLDG
jgi:hypothetical protein